MARVLRIEMKMTAYEPLMARRRPLAQAVWVDCLKFATLMAVLIWLLAKGSERLGYHWQWYRVPKYIVFFDNGHLVPGPLLDGLVVTLQITGMSLVLALCFGLTAAILRLSASWTGRAVARAYLELVRNTPLLVQLLFIYFVISPVLGIGRLASAVLALSLFEGAYTSEILRAGIISIGRGQWEAAHSLGLSTYGAYRFVILPQAFRQVLPPLVSQAISLIKDSALVSTIAIYDLTMRGQVIIAETYLTFELWFTIATMYLVIATTVSLLVGALEKRFLAGPT
jgi:polar amino acid transport system permease protein